MEESETIGLSILVPVYNERATIRRVVEKVRAVPFPTRTEIVVVDDGSTDGTAEALREMAAAGNIRVVVHDHNQGKGKAVQTALRAARGEVVVMQDADDELDPHDLLGLYAVVSRNREVVCYGSRFAGRNRRFWLLPTYWANRFLNGLCNLLNGLRLTDMNTCYKMMSADVARRINLTSTGFAMEPEITTKLARMGVPIVEAPISYAPRGRREGKKIKWLDFLRYVRAIIRFRFGP